MSIPKRLSGVVSPTDARDIYGWLESIPFSRPRRNISRDFADGVMLAELIFHFRPQLVELHNFIPSTSLAQKLQNWNTLNMKVFKKMGFGLHPKDMEDTANMAPGSIERVLQTVRKILLNRSPMSECETDISRISSAKEKIAVQSTRSLRLDPLEELGRKLTAQKQRIEELEETVHVLRLKNSKLEQLLEIKDKKIEALKHVTD